MAARGSDAELAATRELVLIVRRQAEVMALADVFLALTVLFLGCVGLAALMRRPSPWAGAAAGISGLKSNAWTGFDPFATFRAAWKMTALAP